MRAIGISLLCTALWMTEGLPALAQSDSTAEIARPVEQCIRDNAPAVEQVFSSLDDGVTYLVVDLCGAPIAADQERQRRDRAAAAAAAMHAQCEANRPAEAKSDAKQADPCDKPMNNILTTALVGPYLGNLQEVAAAQTRFYETKPPAATSLAAKLLLEIRLKRLNAAQQGTH